MGNACTITTCPRALSSQSSSLFTSLSIPVNSELSEYHGSQGRSSSLSLINQAHIPNSLTTFVTLNANKGYKKPVYALDSRNIQKIIEKQQQADYSLSESEGEDNNQPVSLPRLEDGDDCDANVQSKNWLASKEEENRDIMRRFNLLEGRAKSNEPVNLPIRRTIEERTTTARLYNRDRIEYNDEIKAREERERRIAAGLSKIFGDSSCPIEKIRSNSAVKQRLFPKEDEHKITIKDDSLKRDDPSLSDCSPFNGSSTGVLCTEGDDGSLSGRYINTKSRGVKKSVVESVLARRNICVRKNEDKKENNKSKSLITYCPEEVVEKTIVAELYEGVSQPQSSPSEQAVEIAAPVAKIEVKEEPKTITVVQEKPKEVPVARQLLSERKCDYNTNGTIKALSSVEKKYTSNQGWLSSRKGTENSLHLTGSPTSEFMLFNRELKWDKQLRNESIAERLMESMLEERADEKDTFNLVLASGEKCPLPIIRRNLFDSEKKSYRGDSNRKDRPDSQVRGHESVGSVAKEDGYKTNRQKENDQRMLYETPKKNEKYMIAGNNKENVQQSPSPAKGFVSVTELDAKEDVETGPEPVTIVKEPVIEGVMVEEKKAILDEVENLQKEVFEKVSQVTSDLKKGTLAPEKITELKEIQDKLQKLTRLSSLMHTGDPQNIKPPEKNHNTPINQNKPHVETVMEDEARHKFNTQSHKEIITISSDNICSPVHTDGSFSMKPYDTKPEPTPTKMFDVDISAIVKRKRDRVVTEGDSIIMKPSLMPVESRTTLEFFETEMECQQLLMRQNDLKSFKNLLELDQSGISHRTATSYTKDRRTPGARGQHSAESRKNGSNHLYKQVVETTNPVMFQHMIRKLSYPKNLSTYNEPELNSYRENLKPRASVNNYKEKSTRGSVTERLTQTSSTVRPCKMKHQKQQQPEPLARRQSANPVAKKAVERRSSGPTTTMCSRKTSAEKVRPITPTITATEIKTSNTSRDMSRERVVQGRMSVGTCEGSRSGARDTPNKGSCSSKRTSVDKCMSSERKKKAGPAVVQYRRESTEPCPEGDLFDTAYDTNKVGALREEITKLNQKLDVKRNSVKMVTEPAVEEEDVYAQRMKMHKIGIDRGQKEGAYTARARKRMEYFNPTTFRAEHTTGLSDRRPTAVNMEDQPEQNGDYIMTEPSYVDKSVLMRTKLIEEIAKRQSLMEDSEWVLNMKIPVMPAPGMRMQIRGGLGFK